MKTTLEFPGRKQLRICGWIAACMMAATVLGAQTPAPRLHSEISSSVMTPLKGSLNPMARAQFDAGRMPSDTRLTGMSLVFNRSAAQQADLEALVAAQQNPASPLYHQWLTPDQFAARFGMAQEDLDKAQLWLQQQGFSIDSVARSKNFIRFSGTVGQVEMAFQTQMHYYKMDGAQHFAPSTMLSVPSGLAPAVEMVRNLSDFRPRPMHVLGNPARTRPAFSSSQSTSVFFAPGDIKTVYDFPATGTGYIGTGQSIAIMGQSAIVASNITNFQNAAGLAPKAPTQYLVPSTGSSTVYTGDESESDIDLEWAGAMAPGATIFFVYTGNSANNNGVFDSISYAVDQDIASILSVSYGACESTLGGFNLESVFLQAAAQGQTVIASSGDSGSTACSGDTGLSVTAQQALAVNYPASSPNVTALGGTEISQANAAYMTQGSAYWTAASGSDVLTSALQHIPEVAWNDDVYAINNGATSLSATGGGVSTLWSRPSWQTGVPGIPAGSFRLLPDISLYSSPSYPGYLYCSSDSSVGITGSCAHGFRDANSQYLTVAGGTSFAAPIFAGMLAIINQQQGYTGGQGLINPELYTLAAASTTYAAAFYDITSGNNECASSLGSTYCSSTSGSATSYTTNTGYDEVTGLGSVDLSVLAAAWPASSTSLIATTTTVSASSATPALNASDTFTITVTPVSGSTAPTGTVSVTIDGGTPVTGVALTASGSSAVATYQTSFATTGAHSVLVKYGGDSTFAHSSGVTSVTVPGSSSGSGTFTLKGTNVTVSQGNTAASTITVTPANGYKGTVYLTFDTSNDTALANLCYGYTTTLSNGSGSVTVTSATTPVTTQLSFDTNASDCVASAAQGGARTMRRLLPVKSAANSGPSGPSPAPLGAALAGLLLAGFLGRSSRRFRNLAGLIALLAVGLAVSACGGGGSSGGGGGGTPPADPAKGTYTITLTGQDSATASITAQTTFTLTIN